MSSTHLRTATAAATDVGRRRHGNEDSYALWVSDGSGRSHAADTLLVVCDGMGGSNAGEVASRMAVEAVVREFEEDTSGDAQAALHRAVDTANTEVHEHSRTRQDLQGMGTTCTAVAILGDTLTFAHVGDSRAYLVRSGRMTQITSDHSLVAQLVARGQITAEDARHDPRRNVVTRSVGVGAVVDIDADRMGEPLLPGDTVLVCSDGLHGQLSDEEIAKLASDGSLDRACRTLIALANERGGPDNITVALARIEGGDGGDGGYEAHEAPRARVSAAPPQPRADAPSAPVSSKARTRTLQLLIVALVILLLVIAGIVWFMLGRMRGEAESDAASSATSTQQAESLVAWR